MRGRFKYLSFVMRAAIWEITYLFHSATLISSIVLPTLGTCTQTMSDGEYRKTSGISRGVKLKVKM